MALRIFPITKLVGLFRFLRAYTASDIVWIVVVLSLIGLLCTGIPDRVLSLASESIEIAIAAGLPEVLPSLGNAYIGVMLTAELFFAFAFIITGSLIVVGKKKKPVTLYVAITLVVLGFTQPPINNQFQSDVASDSPQITTFTQLIFESMDAIASISAIVTFYIMPDGKFVPRWTRLLALIWTIAVIVWFFFPTLPFNPVYGTVWDKSPIPSISIFLVGVLTGLYAQIYRWHQVSTEIERQQIRWILVGMLLIASAGIVRFGVTVPEQTPILARIIRVVIAMILSAGFPYCISMAIRFTELWELKTIISQTLVWIMLSLIVIIIFVAIVGGAGIILNSPSSPILSAIATATVAMLFQPIRERMQLLVDRMLFGIVDDPMKVLSSISAHQYASSADPRDLSLQMLRMFVVMLKIPYAAVELIQDDLTITYAEFGSPSREIKRIKFSYKDSLIGYLAVSPRSPGSEFSSKDNILLENFARQIVYVVYMGDMANSLQSAREKLVNLLEDERKRIQNDLHDGIQPALFAHTIKIGNARVELFDDPSQADAILQDLETQIASTITEIRNLLYNLRPLTLNRLGLIGALQEIIAQYESASLQFHFETPKSTSQLPAAVEVAVYNIVQTAIYNVAKHAQAHYCHVYLNYDDKLLNLSVTDDGIGISEQRGIGIGIGSMTKRAEELGGSCEIKSQQISGTIINISIPISAPKKNSNRQM